MNTQKDTNVFLASIASLGLLSALSCASETETNTKNRSETLPFDTKPATEKSTTRRTESDREKIDLEDDAITLSSASKVFTTRQRTPATIYEGLVISGGVNAFSVEHEDKTVVPSRNPLGVGGPTTSIKEQNSLGLSLLFSGAYYVQFNNAVNIGLVVDFNADVITEAPYSGVAGSLAATGLLGSVVTSLQLGIHYCPDRKLYSIITSLAGRGQFNEVNIQGGLIGKRPWTDIDEQEKPVVVKDKSTNSSSQERETRVAWSLGFFVKGSFLV